MPALLAGADVVATVAAQVKAALTRSDVVLYTSRTLVPGRDRGDSLAIARTVSAALSGVVRDALAAGPAWVVAKGGSPPTMSRCEAWVSAGPRWPGSCSPG